MKRYIYLANQQIESQEGMLWQKRSFAGEAIPFINLTSESMGMRHITVFLALLFLASASFSLTSISSCQLLGNVTDTRYVLSSNLYGAPTYLQVGSSSACIIINNSNIELDCNGFTIDANNTSAFFGIYGILVNENSSVPVSNVTIKNCPNITGYTRHIELHNASNGHFNNITIYSLYPNYGMNLFYHSDNNTIHNLTVRDGYSGIMLGLTGLPANLNTISDSTFINNTDGVYLSDSSNNTIIRCNAINNYISGYDAVGSSENNTFTDDNATTSASSLSNGFAVSGAGNVLTGNFVFNSTGDGIAIGGSNNIASNNFAYNVTGSGLVLSGTGNSYSNNDATLCNYGFEISGTDNNISYSRAFFNNQSGFFISLASGDRVTNNNATNNSQNGFHVFGSSGNTISGNLALNNTLSGFTVTWGSIAGETSPIPVPSANNSFISNQAAYNLYGIYANDTTNDSFSSNVLHGNVFQGILLELGSNYTLSGNSVYANAIGTSLFGSMNATITGDHYFDNSIDFNASSNGANSSSYTLSDVVFDSPGGAFVDYTNLSASDAVVSEDYSFSWSSVPFATPSQYFSFSQKFLNITAYPSALIDRITWHWLNSELFAYSESDFSLWKYNASGWTLLNNSPDTIANTLRLASMNPASVYAILQYNNTIPPSITLVAPANGYSATLNTPTNITFTFNATDDLPGAMSCSLYLDSTLAYSNSSVLNGALTSTAISVNAGLHTWSVTCLDSVENANASPTYSFTLTNPPPPSSESHPSKKSISGEFSAGCDENVVTATSGGSALSGVDVKILRYGTLLVPIGSTNSSGQFGFSGLDGDVKIYLDKSDYYSFDMAKTLKTSAECAPAPECTTDSDCPANYTCQNNKCVAQSQPPPPPVPPECSDSSSCSSDEYCGGGSCIAVQSGTCGSILNHTWTNYECCFDGDCSTGFECKSNKCVEKEYNLAGQGGLVGGNSTITAYIDSQIYPNTDLRVTNPDGSSEVVKTDSNGQITLSLALAGNYTVDLMANGIVKKSLVIPAIATEPGETGRLTLFDVLAQQSWLLLILLAVALFLAYRYFVSRKGKNK